MKIKIPGLSGRYPVKLKEENLLLPEKILFSLEGIKGFTPLFKQEEGFNHIEMFPSDYKKWGYFPIENRILKIPGYAKQFLGIESEGYLLKFSDRFELWGPSWLDYFKQQTCEDPGVL